MIYRTKVLKLRETLFMVSGVFAFGIVYFIVLHLFFKNPTLDTLMIQSANNLNKNCPVMVDHNIRFDSAISLSDNVFQYNYTFVNLSKGEINIQKFKKNIEPHIVKNAKTNPDFKIYRDNKVTLTYNYKDMNGELVYKFSLTPDMYS